MVAPGAISLAVHGHGHIAITPATPFSEVDYR